MTRRLLATEVRAALCAAALAVTGSCGGSPTAPAAPALNLAGSWTGAWTYMAGGATVADTVTLTLNQNGVSVAGLWAAASGPGGQIVFEAGASVSGTVSFSQTLLSGVNCSATTTVSGTASSTSLQFNVGTLPQSGLCQWPPNQQFVFTR